MTSPTDLTALRSRAEQWFGHFGRLSTKHCIERVADVLIRELLAALYAQEQDTIFQRKRADDRVAAYSRKALELEHANEKLEDAEAECQRLKQERDAIRLERDASGSNRLRDNAYLLRRLEILEGRGISLLVNVPVGSRATYALSVDKQQQASGEVRGQPQEPVKR